MLILLPLPSLQLGREIRKQAAVHPALQVVGSHALNDIREGVGGGPSGQRLLVVPPFSDNGVRIEGDVRIHGLEERLGPHDGLGAGVLRRAQPVVRDLEGDRLDGLTRCALDTLRALGAGLTLGAGWSRWTCWSRLGLADVADGRLAARGEYRAAGQRGQGQCRRSAREPAVCQGFHLPVSFPVGLPVFNNISTVTPS